MTDLRHPTHAIAYLLLLPFLCIVLMNGAVAQETPSQVVGMTVNAVIETLGNDALSPAEKLAQIDRAVSERFDFKAMSSRVLATNWSKASRTQQEAFTDIFKQLLVKTYWQKISAYQNETVEFLGENVRSERLATCFTVIRTNSANIPVDYKLHLVDGHWYAYDVVIEQVSLVRNYRGRFQTIVRDSGIDSLISQLQETVVSNSKDGEG